MFFKSDPNKIVDLERDVQLSELVIRCLVQNVDHITEEEMKEIAARPANHSAVEADRITGRWSAVEASAKSAGGRSSSGGERSANDRHEGRPGRGPKGRVEQKDADAGG